VAAHRVWPLVREWGAREPSFTFCCLIGFQGYDVAFGLGYWVAVGIDATNTIMYSSDGGNWTGLGVSVFNVHGLAITFANGQFLAGGHGNGTGPSGNNTLVTIAPPSVVQGLGDLVFSNFVHGIAFFNNLWIAVGSGASNSLASSIDGRNFFGLGNGLFSQGHGVATDAILPPSRSCGTMPACTCTGSSCTSSVSVSVSGALSVSTASTLTVVQSLTLLASAVVSATIANVPQVPLVSVNANATVNGMLMVAIGNIPFGVATIISAAAVTGVFSSYQVVALNNCTKITSSALMYSSSTITLSFATSTSLCGLSAGAIIGITIGCVAFGGLLVLAMVWFIHWARAKTDLRANQEIRAAELTDIKRP
jgi:hypothetical protein